MFSNILFVVNEMISSLSLFSFNKLVRLDSWLSMSFSTSLSSFVSLAISSSTISSIVPDKSSLGHSILLGLISHSWIGSIKNRKYEIKKIKFFNLKFLRNISTMVIAKIRSKESSLFVNPKIIPDKK